MCIYLTNFVILEDWVALVFEAFWITDSQIILIMSDSECNWSNDCMYFTILIR